MLEVKTDVTICPCCGAKSNKVLSEGCAACGARAVGEPLPRPEYELPSYVRALVLAVTGTLMVLAFATQTFVALIERSGRGATSNLALLSMIPLDVWSWIAAAETAAWRLKWAAIPVTIFVLWGSRKLYRSVVLSPDRFCGLRYARRGYLACLAVPLLILILIGATVPERLHSRQLGIEAGLNVQAYRIDRALNEYREKFGSFPSYLNDLSRLPDQDGSLAAALKDVDWSNYKPSAELAAAPKQKPQPLRGAVILKASTNAPDSAPTESISFTNYELPIPGPDKIFGTEDDLVLRDGVITTSTETTRRGNTRISNQSTRP